ncbi:MAG: VOC family protein [Candidatus Eremiobacteraeota bacterium]|nr:VOC family protein [Candidatus Eremiobacteraeota bacterium]
MDVAEKTAIKGIDITTYLVKDVERATKFYTETMGMRVTMDYRGQGAEFTFGDGTTFGIWKMEDGSWHPSGGVMFGVDDISAAVDHYKSRGVKFQAENDQAIMENPVCWMAFAEDSEGNNFMFHQRKS